jgi:hypothetical protein
LARDADAAAADARSLADWRHHFRTHPWLFCGAAAAIGFLLVPAKSAPAVGISLGNSHPPAPQPPPAPRSLLANGLGLVASFVARQSLNYVARRGLDWLEVRGRQRRESPSEQNDAGGAHP